MCYERRSDDWVVAFYFLGENDIYLLSSNRLQIYTR